MMPTKDLKKKGRRARPVIIAVILAGLIAGSIFIPRAGVFLVAKDRFTHADTAVVLSGGAVTRSLAARDLYLDRRVDRILVIPEHTDPASNELIRLGLLDPKLPPWSERILVASGVPRDKIKFLPEPLDGTITEALRVREFLRDNMPSKLIIITSSFASHRARFIFRHVLKDRNVEVLSYPTKYGPFEAERWWSQPRNALTVVMEYQKWVVNALTLALGLHR